MMKSIASVLVAASIGTCGQKPLPPPPVETSTTSEAATADRLAGLPEECRELMTDCSTCDEVERMRQQILAKKCVPVCDAYVDEAARIARALPAEGAEILRGEGVCAKEGTTCTPIEDSACALALSYVGAGEKFRTFWAEPGAAPPTAELIERFHSGLLSDFLEVQTRAARWGADNGADAGPVLRAGGELLQLTCAEEVEGYRAEVESALRARPDAELQERHDAIVALIALAREPGDPATFAVRRKALEQIAIRGADDDL